MKYKVKIERTLTWENIEVEARSEEEAVAKAEKEIEANQHDPTVVQTTDQEVEVIEQKYGVTLYMVVKVDVGVTASNAEEAIEMAWEESSSYSLGDAEYVEDASGYHPEVRDGEGNVVTPSNTSIGWRGNY